MRHRGGQEIDARDQKIGLMQQAGSLLESRLGAAGKQLGARDQRIAAMQQAGELLETRVATGSKTIGARNREIRALQEGMGREGAARQKSEQDMMGGQKRQLEREQKMRGRYQAEIGAGKAKISQLQEGMGREGIARQRSGPRSCWRMATAASRTSRRGSTTAG